MIDAYALLWWSGLVGSGMGLGGMVMIIRANRREITSLSIAACVLAICLGIVANWGAMMTFTPMVLEQHPTIWISTEDIPKLPELEGFGVVGDATGEVGTSD